MGDIIKFVAGSLLVLFLLAFAIPLLWLVVKLFVWVFGSLFGGVIICGGGIFWLLVIIVSIGVIIWSISN